MCWNFQKVSLKGWLWLITRPFDPFCFFERDIFGSTGCIHWLSVHQNLTCHLFSQRTLNKTIELNLFSSSTLEISRKWIIISTPAWASRKCIRFYSSWWRHQMETFSALLAICAWNSPVTGEFISQRPVTRSFDVFFDLRLNKPLSKQSRGRWIETPSRWLWRHCNVTTECHTPWLAS